MTRIRNIAALAAALALLAIPGSAGASGEDVIRDCADDGQFSRHYSPDDLNWARDHLPTDIREYTDCKSLIEAELARSRGGPPGSTPGGSIGPETGYGGVTTPSGAAGTPDAVAALKDATANASKGKPSTEANGEALIPAASGLNNVPGAANALPSPLLAAIVAVIVLCALGGIAATWRRWPALARAPLRLFRR
jgi:hypothetical protein